MTDKEKLEAMVASLPGINMPDCSLTAERYRIINDNFPQVGLKMRQLYGNPDPTDFARRVCEGKITCGFFRKAVFDIFGDVKGL